MDKILALLFVIHCILIVFIFFISLFNHKIKNPKITQIISMVVAFSQMIIIFIMIQLEKETVYVIAYFIFTLFFQLPLIWLGGHSKIKLQIIFNIFSFVLLIILVISYVVDKVILNKNRLEDESYVSVNSRKKDDDEDNESFVSVNSPRRSLTGNINCHILKVTHRAIEDRKDGRPNYTPHSNATIGDIIKTMNNEENREEKIDELFKIDYGLDENTYTLLSNTDVIEDIQDHAKNPVYLYYFAPTWVTIQRPGEEVLKPKDDKYFAAVYVHELFDQILKVDSTFNRKDGLRTPEGRILEKDQHGNYMRLNEYRYIEDTGVIKTENKL